MERVTFKQVLGVTDGQPVRRSTLKFRMTMARR